MEKLHNVENMQRCINQFEKYMFTSHDLNITKDFPTINPRRIMFNIMSNIKEDPDFYSFPLKTLNNITLNQMRDFFIEQSRVQKKKRREEKIDGKKDEYLHHNASPMDGSMRFQENVKRPNPRILDREKLLYGDRPMLDADRLPMPMNTNNIDQFDPDAQDDKQKLNYQFEQIAHERKQEQEKNKKDDGNVGGMSQIQDSKISLDEFQLELQRMQKERGTMEELATNETKENQNEGKKINTPSYKDSLALNPKSNHKIEMFEEGDSIVNEKPRIKVTGDGVFDEPIDSVTTKTNFQGFYKKPAPSYVDENVFVRSSPMMKNVSSPYYITFNGYDRDWVKQRMRFKFNIDTTNLKKTYKNIIEVSFPKIIIPAEVFDVRSVQNPMPKMNYTHKFSLAVPYILLMVDEMIDVSDGVNETNQKAFAHYVQDCTFNTDNGRGYHIMKAMQDEVKVFNPTILASLPRLNFTIAKPNGLPFNNSKDNYYVWKIEYPEYNRPYLKVVLDKFFDKNEFFKGDTVFIKNFRIPVFDKELVQSNEETGTPNTEPAYLKYIENAYTFNRIMEFMNRPEGHDILEVDKANPEGFCRSFMIHAPGSVDAENGRFVINKQMIDLIKQHSTSSHCDSDELSSGTPIKAGDLINMSLQAVISMRLKTLLGTSDNITTRDLI